MPLWFLLDGNLLRWIFRFFGMVIEIRASNDNNDESNSFYHTSESLQTYKEHSTMRMYSTYAVYNDNLSDPYSTTFLQWMNNSRILIFFTVSLFFQIRNKIYMLNIRRWSNILHDFCSFYAHLIFLFTNARWYRCLRLVQEQT